MATFFSSPSVHGHTLHCANRWVKVLEEGNAEGYWDNPRAPSEAAAGGNAATNTNTDGAPEQQQEGAQIDESVFNAGNRAEDIARVRNEGYEVDDDNDPAPENIPAAGSQVNNNGGLYEGQSGEEVKTHFNREGVSVGDTGAVSGHMDGVSYNFWCMKEPNYIMSCMATGGRLLSDATCKVATRSWVENGVNIVKSFAYALPFDWHFRYRHAVDDHNNLRHALPSIEDTWLTTRWELRVLAFVLALCEVNSYLALKYFVFAGVMDVMPTLLVFRRKLAWQLIKNRWVVDLETNDANLVEARTHKLMTAPHFALRYHNLCLLVVLTVVAKSS